MRNFINTNDKETFTDTDISKFIKSPKKILGKSKTKINGTTKRRNIAVKDNDDRIFKVYLRQSTLRKNDFSCGLSLILKNGSHFTLIRCNGNSHSHKNALEGNKLDYRFHIHRASERYIKRDKKPDGFASETKEYQTLDEAYQFLLNECSIDDTSINQLLFTDVDIWN